jgi:hypothetical protein
MVHGLLFWISLGPEAAGATDVNLYAYWMDSASQGAGWPVIDFDCVYPVAALIPMALAQVLARLCHIGFMLAWLLLMAGINAAASVAVYRLLGRVRGGLAVALWLASLALLGPTALTRVDSVAGPLILVGIAAATRSTTIATCLLTFGAWVKVAPGAVVLPLFAMAKQRWREVAAPGLLVSVGVVGGAMLVGAPLSRVLGFFTKQADRGLQIESVAATPFVLWRALRGEQISVFDEPLGTYQLAGSAPSAVAHVLDPVLVIGAIGLALLAYRARARAAQALPVAALGILTAMIVTNKVGSPQFVAWILPAVAIGLAMRWESPSWRIVGGLTGGIALFTHVLYPLAYSDFLNGALWAVAMEALRNAGLVALAAAAVWRLWRLGRQGAGPAR